jgi:subtilase family serine protease
VATITLPLVPAGTSLDGIEVDLTAADIGKNGFRAEVDDGNAVAECDESNNGGSWVEAFCP